MDQFTRSFQKIIPSLRESTMEIIEQYPIHGTLFLVPAKEREIEVFLHRTKRENAPVVFEFHGGGFVLGDAKKDDNLREYIKNSMDVNVIGVNYRKAPEYPYPAAIKDAYEVLCYFYKNAAMFHFDREHFLTLGFSAGANLATIMGILGGQKGDFSLCGQILHYPYLDAYTEPEHKKKHPADLPVEVMQAFTTCYVPEDFDKRNSTISPLYASPFELSGIKKAALFLAGEDALRSEGEQYADQLSKAGVPIYLRVVEYAYHGYFEDLWNRPCYEALPEDTRQLHPENIEKIAQMSMQDTIEAIRWICEG